MADPVQSGTQLHVHKAMIRRFFKWLWALTPWGRSEPPELPDTSPRLFHIPAEAEWPECSVLGSLCIVDSNKDWIGGLYMFTEEGWLLMPPEEPHDAV